MSNCGFTTSYLNYKICPAFVEAFPWFFSHLLPQIAVGAPLPRGSWGVVVAPGLAAPEAARAAVVVDPVVLPLARIAAVGFVGFAAAPAVVRFRLAPRFLPAPGFAAVL